MQKLTAYITLTTILVCGLLLFYRGFQSSNSLIKIETKILEKKIEAVSIHNGTNRYGLTFKTKNHNTKFGIYVGAYNESLNSKYLELVDTNNIYTFLIDPTVFENNGINLGVRRIILNDKIIYKESHSYTLLGGIVFILLGASGLIIVNRFKKTQKT